MSESLFYYENEIDNVYSFIPFEYVDFMDILKLWTTETPYNEYPAKSIKWRLIPAFENHQIMMFKKGLNTIGFISWAWMTTDEYESLDYSGEMVFSRGCSDRLVIADMIVIGGNKNVKTCIKHLREFGKGYYPEVERVYFHRQKDGKFLKINKRKD